MLNPSNNLNIQKQVAHCLCDMHDTNNCYYPSISYLVINNQNFVLYGNPWIVEAMTFGDLVWTTSNFCMLTGQAIGKMVSVKFHSLTHPFYGNIIILEKKHH